MKALGRRHRPFFRICAMDSRTGRDGCPIEELGHYDPMCKDAQTQTVLDVSRVRYWLSVGAQPSHKVQVLLNKFGVKKPAPGEPWKVAETPAAAPVAPAHKTAPTAHAPAGAHQESSAPAES
jgi:small subunit ribosomal protein S16